MGFNTWNIFAENINEELIRDTAAKMVELWLKDIGYEYIVIDDCWSEKQRDKDGRLGPSREKFPNGIKSVSEYVHSKGLKLGIYSCVGNRTCGNYPGSLIELTDDGAVVMTAFKQAADGDGYILRLYEPTGRALSCRIDIPLMSVSQDIDFSPFELKTFRVVYGSLSPCTPVEEVL